MYETPQHPLVEAQRRQRREALAIGNRKRAAMARLKRMIKSGEIDGLAVLLGHHEEWQETLDTMTVGQFVKSIPRFGEGTRDEILAEMQISGDLRMAQVSTSQRNDLARIVRLIRGD